MAKAKAAPAHTEATATDDVPVSLRNDSEHIEVVKEVFEIEVEQPASEPEPAPQPAHQHRYGRVENFVYNLRGNENGPEAEVSIDDVMELQTRLDSMKAGAITALLAGIAADRAKLITLGYVEQTPEPEWMAPAPRTMPEKKAGVGRGRGSKPKDERFCKVCNVAGHDGRQHRHHPKKFTASELAAM